MAGYPAGLPLGDCAGLCDHGECRGHWCELGRKPELHSVAGPDVISVHRALPKVFEWVFTILFTTEALMRREPLKDLLCLSASYGLRQVIYGPLVP